MAFMKKRKRYGESVRINPDLMKQIREIAAHQGSMVSWVVNKAIADWVQVLGETASYKAWKEKKDAKAKVTNG